MAHAVASHIATAAAAAPSFMILALPPLLRRPGHPRLVCIQVCGRGAARAPAAPEAVTSWQQQHQNSTLPSLLNATVERDQMFNWQCMQLESLKETLRIIRKSGGFPTGVCQPVHHNTANAAATTIRCSHNLLRAEALLAYCSTPSNTRLALAIHPSKMGPAGPPSTGSSQDLEEEVDT